MSMVSVLIWLPRLARELHEVNQLGVFFDTIHQDPVLSTIKLIAEPWIWAKAAIKSEIFP